MKEKIYRNLDKELDKIILTEITVRFREKQKKLSVWKVNDILEKKNSEVVKLHQQSRISSNLPALFRGYLEIKSGGRLFFGKEDLDKKEFDLWFGKKSRLEVLINASLNALDDEELRNIFYRKKKRFEDAYQKAKEITGLIADALEIQKIADIPDSRIPKDEESAIAYLKELEPLKASLQKTESRYIELLSEPYLSEILRQLQNAIHLAAKSLSAKGKKSSEFVFYQVSALFKRAKKSGTHLADLEDSMNQKEALVRYYTLFDSIGDESRKKEIASFISTVEKNIGRLQKKVDEQKQHDNKISDENSRKIAAAYQDFLEIKKNFAEGSLDAAGGQKNAVSKLTKCRDILNANGQRVKAREIDRFLNSTGIAKTDENLKSQYLFYKRAFMILLPITIGLALMNAYHIVLQYRAKEVPAVRAVKNSAEKEKKSSRDETLKKEASVEKAISVEPEN
ncbi:MAG: hypothetical protein BWK80_07350 [Desulfobacteraceae bacterium IS3]|nr:MAG: hypothetical protein BWK80_07350 [Desulfobacteraceae bacterium IS3]